MGIGRSQTALTRRNRAPVYYGPVGYGASSAGAGTNGDPRVVTYSGSAGRDGTITVQVQLTETATSTKLSGNVVQVAVTDGDAASVLAAAVAAAFTALSIADLTVGAAGDAVTFTPAATHTLTVITSL